MSAWQTAFTILVLYYPRNARLTSAADKRLEIRKMKPANLLNLPIIYVSSCQTTNIIPTKTIQEWSYGHKSFWFIRLVCSTVAPCLCCKGLTGWYWAVQRGAYWPGNRFWEDLRNSNLFSKISFIYRIWSHLGSAHRDMKQNLCYDAAPRDLSPVETWFKQQGNGCIRFDFLWLAAMIYIYVWWIATWSSIDVENSMCYLHAGKS